VPEVRFALEGPDGFLGVLERRLAARHHAVIVVAEGVGQELFDGAGEEERREMTQRALSNPRLERTARCGLGSCVIRPRRRSSAIVDMVVTCQVSKTFPSPPL